MRIRVGAFVVLSLIPALLCAGEDRTERIDGAKGWKELDYRGDSLVEERSFDREGTLLSERRFNPEALPIVTKRYVREEGRLLRIEATDASGNPIGSMRYHYDREGRLIALSSEGVLGEGAVGLIAPGGAPQGSWIESDAKSMVLAYDAEGRAVLLQSMQEGKATYIERRSYGEGGIPVSVAIEDKVSGISVTTDYDKEGRQSQRREVKGKGEEILTRYLYDDSGRLVEEERRSGGHLLSIRKIYAESGAVSRVETRRDRTLVLAVDYIENGRVEELYDEGALFAKATYIGGRKVKDEFFADGELLRSREYQ
jgi:hypothetical protein